MLVLLTTAIVGVLAGLVAWALARRWPAAGVATPRVGDREIREEVRSHRRLAAFARTRMDPTSITGLALTLAVAIAAACVAGFGVLLLMVRNNYGFARLDQAATRFGAHHATPLSTTVLRDVTQLGGALVLVPLAAVVALIELRRQRQRRGAVVAFLAVTIGGQYLIVDVVKWIVDRARPNLDRLTGFSGPSFPSGHAAAAAATFAAFALVMGRGRTLRTKAVLSGAATSLAVVIACTRVLLGVHWLTDVLAGLAIGWAWFALCSIAFGGRMLRFGAPVEVAEQAAAGPASGAEADPAESGADRRHAVGA